MPAEADVCQSLNLVPVIVEMQPGEIGGSIDQLTQHNVQALMFGDDVGVVDEIANAATKRGLPTMAYDHVAAQKYGALIAYSATWDELFRRRAENIDRILRGAKPSDLPVRQPTKFDLVINLKTAKALGITVPKDLLLRGDEVIQ